MRYVEIDMKNGIKNLENNWKNNENYMPIFGDPSRQCFI